MGDKCSIYQDRPDLCIYEKVYELVKDNFTLKEYDKLSIQYCEQLQNLKIQREQNDKKTSFIKTAN